MADPYSLEAEAAAVDEASAPQDIDEDGFTDTPVYSNHSEENEGYLEENEATTVRDENTPEPF